MQVDAFLKQMIERGGSDAHLKVGKPPGARIAGEIQPQGNTPLKPEHTEAIAKALLSDQDWERFQECGDLDTAYSLPGVARFRVNVMRQRGSVSIVLRYIPNEIPTFERLGLPDICKKLAAKPRGLVLVTGPTGSGKSTTLAAMIDLINSTHAGHVLTMEDPIEFLHKDKKCYINQREVGADTSGFNEALRRALRQDPDVILIGEMRDLETISMAVTAAETGHLVFGTLHTTGATKTIDRIVNVFPHEQQTQIRMQLAGTLQGIISQTLVPKNGGGRVAAIEILVATDSVRAIIRENKMAQLTSAMQTGKKHGMQLLEEHLSQLVAARKITHESAVSKANSPDNIKPDSSAAPARTPARR
ncbi:MAG: type IV pilus twitching motility protein PilT [Candidatus Latescibacterota bacterium]|nr:MAG: type IV pilus twitching motility protein PilT [Candidatus Latescibacterota bacterium]